MINNDIALLRANVKSDRYILPITLTNGNEGRTKHFSESAKRRKQYEKLIGYMVLGRQLKCYRDPVTVAVVRILGQKEHPWDSSSGLRGNWKEIEDALVSCGVFQDDSIKWITETRFFQDDTKRTKGPLIEMIVVNR